jgi:hypothetical protein
LPDPARVRFGEPVHAAESPLLPPAVTEQKTTANGSANGVRTGAADTSEGETAERRPRSPRDEFSELDAIRYVWEYAERELGVREVRDRQRDRCGWDLEFVYPDGRVELVEVKGSVGLEPFEITRNELEKSRQHHADYVVYLLAEQAGERPLLLRFDDFGLRVAERHLRAASWAVIGWRDLDPVVIEVELPGA